MWLSSVPVVAWYEAQCAQVLQAGGGSPVSDAVPCHVFAGLCSDVLHLLSKEAQVTILAWVEQLKKKLIFEEARRLLYLLLTISNPDMQRVVMTVLQEVESLMYGEVKEKERTGEENKEEQKKEQKEKQKNFYPDGEEYKGDPDLYKVLEVSRDATTDQIKSAYHRLALKWHPDKNESENAQEMFLLIKRAYDILVNPTKRKKYDRGEGNESDNPRQVEFKSEILRGEGKRRIYWRDPDTGEEGFFDEDLTEEEILEEEGGRKMKSKKRPTARHCCLNKSKA